jgi:hypothetical protein
VTAAARARLGAALRELRCGAELPVRSEDLGWDTLPSSTQYVPFPVVATYNEAGIRSHRSYSVEKPPGIRRIAALGDSYTHGHGVSDADAWTTRLATTTGAEVLNFGVGYYGLGQSFLKYQLKARAYHSDVVLICYYDRDLMRDVNRFRYWFNPNNQTFIPTASLPPDRNWSSSPIPVGRWTTTATAAKIRHSRPATTTSCPPGFALRIRLLRRAQILRCAAHAIRRPREPRYYVDGDDPPSEAFQVTAAILRTSASRPRYCCRSSILPSEESSSECREACISALAGGTREKVGAASICWTTPRREAGRGFHGSLFRARKPDRRRRRTPTGCAGS